MSTYDLYSYYRSSCSARLRIAMNLKGNKYNIVPVNVLENEQYSDKHRAVNPSCTVPCLIGKDDKGSSLSIGQSIAALEYLDEAHPEQPLLPPKTNLKGRATVRTLVNIISSDIAPVTNMPLVRRLHELGGDPDEWNKERMTKGLGAFETLVADVAGEFSYGNEITMADVVLVPAIWNARRFKVEVEQFPTIVRVMKNLEEIQAISDASYHKQPDTPEDMRQA